MCFLPGQSHPTPIVFNVTEPWEAKINLVVHNDIRGEYNTAAIQWGLWHICLIVSDSRPIV